MPKLVETNFTDNLIRNTKPRESRFDLYDAKVRGLGLRVSPTGTKSWFAMKRVRGQMTRRTIGRYPQISLADARIIGAKQLAAMAAGEQEPQKDPETVGVVVSDWLERNQASNRTVRQVRNTMTHDVLPLLGRHKLTDVTKTDINRVIDKIVDRGKGVQANRTLAYLRRFFNWCVERDLLSVNPTHGIPKPTIERARERVLSPTELFSVVGSSLEMPYPFGPYFYMLALTGQRRVEVASVEWSEIDLDHRQWTIPGAKAKNGRQHLVHLAQPLVDVLGKMQTRKSGPFVFTTTGDRPIAGFSKAKGRLDLASGVNDWKLHDLRRTFATHATERLGLSHVVIDKVLNHQSGAVRGIAAVYQRGQYLEERAMALDAWANWIHSEGGTSL